MKLHAHALILGLLLLAPDAAAQTPHAGVTLEDLTWTELRDRIAAGKTTIIVPIGGTEQNGPHMALGKHNVRVKVAGGEDRADARQRAGGAGRRLRARRCGMSPPTAHMRFPGTITIPDAAFEKVLESAARSFRQHGFRDVVFLGDHGGYQKDLQSPRPRLNREWAATRARAHAIDEYYRGDRRHYPRR